MRPYDIYKREYGYFKKFGVCKHAEECKKLRPEDFASCPGFDGYICEPMRKYFLLGKSLQQKKMPTQKPMHYVNHTKLVEQRINGKTIHKSIVAGYSLFGLIGVFLYAIIIYMYGIYGFIFGAEPLICFMLTLLSHNSVYDMTINKNDRKAARKFMWIFICCFVVGVICAFVQIQHWVYNNANPILFTITTLIMLYPIACILMYLDIEMKKRGFKL